MDLTSACCGNWLLGHLEVLEKAESKKQRNEQLDLLLFVT